MRISHIIVLGTLSFACIGGAGYAASALVHSYQASQVCIEQSVEWDRISNNSVSMNDPKQHTFYATELAKLRVACGREDKVFAPAQVIALAAQPNIIERAHASLKPNP